MDPWAEYRIPSQSRTPRQPQNAGEEFYARIARDAMEGEARDRQRQAVTKIDANPDQAAEARRIAQETGAPAPVVRESLGDFKQDQQRSQVAQAARDPRMGNWLAENADISSDDISALLHLGSTVDRFNSLKELMPGGAARRLGLDYEEGAAAEYRRTATPAQRRRDNALIDQARDPFVVEERMARGTWGQIAGSLRAGTAQAAGGFYGLGANVAGIVGADDTERFLLDVVEAADEYAADNRGRSSSFVNDALLQGFESTPVALGGLLTGSSKMALGLFFTTSAGNSYAEARGAGLGVGRSTLYGTSQGAIEVVTEKLPTGRLLDIAKGNGSVSNAVKRFIIGEAVGEQVATVLQDFNTWATINPDTPFMDYVRARPEAAARTFLGTVSGAGPQAAVAYGINRAFREEARLEQSEMQLDALDALIQGSADSKVRGRDPKAFRALLDSLSRDGEKIYVPAEAIAEFNQDYREDQFWGDYAAEIDEGLATGGDVGISLGDAATRLAGTPDWDAVSNVVKIGADGASRSEIEQANAELEALKIEASEQLDAEDRAARRDAAPGERLREGIRSQLMNTGMTPDVAAANAEIVAALYETEAKNLGRAITGREFSDSVAVQRVLPELLATPEASDTLDMIINAMRQGNDPQVGVGPSLLQFIAKRGGINDVGGDLASMGMPKRLIRDFDPRQAAMGGISGEGDYGPDSTLRAAIEAGYFSDLANVENETGVSTLDTQVLLDAIGQELGGEKVFAETREDQFRQAGQELRDILIARDVDPSTATDEEIRAAVDAFESEQRATYDQKELPETIEIDGVERSTVNSEGQPLALDEEGVRAFWEWFGDSKVVDADGRPLVVYHGTGGQFEAFDPERSIGGQFWFTTDRAAIERGEVGAARSGEIIEAYLAISNPADWSAYDRLTIDEMIQREKMDGMALVESDSTTFVAFSPTQIKSVNNRGTFDANDPRILYQRESHPFVGMTREEFLGSPKITSNANAADLVPKVLKSVETAEEVPFNVGDGLTAKYHENGAAVLKNGKVIASYNTGDTLVVAKGHRRKGIAEELVYQWRMRFPQSPPATSRTKASQKLQEKIWERIQSEINDPSRELNQEGDKGPNAQIQFTEARAIIRLFENSNASSFQHEMAHFWLERFKSNAMQSVDTDGNPSARQTFADWETLKSWFKENGHAVAEDGTIPTEAHELFARSWERYLMEGKAPKTSLQSAFRKFASWLRAIYRTVKNLNAPITPEVREVMDRMLATEDEIAMAAEDRAMKAMFDDAADAGMSEADAKRYGELSSEARSEAEEELLGKVMRSIRAREQKQWKAQERTVRAEVSEMIESRPVFKALAMLRDTERLDKQWVITEYGEDALGLLPAGVPPIYKDGGGNADQIAEMVGFESGDKMVRELMGLEAMRKDMKANGDKRSVKKALIDQEVAREMHDRFGDPLGDGSIEREAQAAIQNERQGERIELELKALASQTTRRATPYALAREWARERISNGVVADTISGEAQYRYTRTAAKASREAQAAFARGDAEAAFQHKQTEMLHNALAREAAKANEKVESAIKRMGKLADQRTVKTMAQDYLDRIHGLLEGYEFKRVSQRQIDARDEYARWAQEQTEAGHDVVAVERLAQKKNWSRMTVEELISLDDAVKQLVHMGRYKQTLIDGKERREFDAVVGEAIASANELPQKKAKNQFGGETRLDWIKGGFASAHSMLVKMEDVFDRLDNDRPNGVFNRVAFQPLVEAQAREQVMLDDVMGRLMSAMAEVPKKTIKGWHDRRTIDELPGVDKYGRPTNKPVKLLGEELVVMAMNMGNRGNMEKLIAGYGWDKRLGGMDQAREVVMDVLNRELTVEDWQYVQTVWDTIDELWPEIRDLEKRVNGFAPDKVEATPIETTAGTLKGGYFPVVYDPESKVGGRNLEVEERGLFASSYFRSTTRAGSTHERTQFKGPLHLSLGVINRHVAEVVHDITHREAVMNADKFLSDDRVQQAVIDAMGPEIAQQFRPWLSHVANEWATDREGNSQAERFLKATRTNATIVGLGFRISTIMLQISGYANSIERIGVKPVARGIRKMLSGSEAWTFALENSQELKSRMTTMDRDIRDNARRLASKQKGYLDAAQRFAFHGIGYMDRLVSVGTWHGAYDKALGEGMDHDQAVYAADKAVRQSQGSGAAKDMARVQRGTGKMGEAWKLSTMFYSYSSAFYQRQVKLYRDTGDAIRERDLDAVPDLAARFLWLNIVPALLSQWLAGRGPEEDEDEAAWALSHIITSQFQAIPFAREIAGGLQSGFGYSYTPAEGFGKSIVAVVKDVDRVIEGEDTKRATRNFLEALGYTTGKVPGQLAQSTQFLVNVGYGEEDPETIADWWDGLTKGKIED